MSSENNFGVKLNGVNCGICLGGIFMLILGSSKKYLNVIN